MRIRRPSATAHKNSTGLAAVICSRNSAVVRFAVPLARPLRGTQPRPTLQRIGRETPPFVVVPRPDAKVAHWAEPKLVCEVEFTTWTRDGRVRHTSSSQALIAQSALLPADLKVV